MLEFPNLTDFIKIFRKIPVERFKEIAQNGMPANLRSLLFPWKMSTVANRSWNTQENSGLKIV